MVSSWLLGAVTGLLNLLLLAGCLFACLKNYYQSTPPARFANDFEHLLSSTAAPPSKFLSH
jgi:hypothetical protein